MYKKPIYKKWWFWIAIVVVIGVIGNLGEKDTQANEPIAQAVAEPSQKEDSSTEQTTADKKQADADKLAAEEQKAKDDAAAEELAKKEAEANSIPREHKAALEKAHSYAEVMSMSKKGIYDQLTSEYGENFPKEAAQYAIDNLKFDWKENALKKAQSYAETMSMSDSAIYDQLISEYGEKFTKEEAKYAIDNLE
ncbi:Ltp family lipoprotein [Paenibacillus illinoisensis]|uniref:Ltp family lipoprotein n=1 Tax=Paenibacillus illinoisensis TaxID=59845 RepID=UPI00203D135D|nr:Ltp family lipoprotein [Paenibacillus illinoisensis]MCM3206373.1 Ltp family lipoprotein [Paenibacillus illinoisensis]